MFLIGPPSLKDIIFFRGLRENQWKLPILGSILVHVLILGGSSLSSYFFSDRDIKEIHTVDLVNIAEYQPPKKLKETSRPEKKVQPPPPEPKKEPEPEIRPEPEPEKISTKIAEKEILPQNSGPPEEVVSLKPRLTKRIIKSPEKSREEKKHIDEALQRIKREMRRKEAEEKARKAEEEAKAYARQAVKDLSELLKTQENVTAGQERAKEERTTRGDVNQENVKKSEGDQPGKSGSNNTVSEAVLNQYLAAVYREIQANWILPEVADWSEDLEAILLITVTKEGTVIKSRFEKHSDNIYFNRFVEKTLKRSSPLPPIPDILEKEQIEIGLIFHPEGLE